MKELLSFSPWSGLHYPDLNVKFSYFHVALCCYEFLRWCPKRKERKQNKNKTKKKKQQQKDKKKNKTKQDKQQQLKAGAHLKTNKYFKGF